MGRRDLLPECKPYAAEARLALNRASLFTGFRNRVARETDNVELIELRNTTPIVVRLNPSPPGHWWVHFSWTLRRVPRDDPILWRSSFGLSARGLDIGPPDTAVSLVRYDVDNERPGHGVGALGAHLNVWQPAPLEDKVHFPVLSDPGRHWRVQEVLDFLVSPQLATELVERLAV